MKLEPLDPYVSHVQQIDADTLGPVVLVNIFHVQPDKADALATHWGDNLRRFHTLPGFLSAQFHRGTAGSGTFLNDSMWESVEHYRAAFKNPDFEALLAGYPEGTVATPHLFQKEAIAGVCVT